MPMPGHSNESRGFKRFRHQNTVALANAIHPDQTSYDLSRHTVAAEAITAKLITVRDPARFALNTAIHLHQIINAEPLLTLITSMPLISTDPIVRY